MYGVIMTPNVNEHIYSEFKNVDIIFMQIKHMRVWPQQHKRKP